MNEQDTPYQRLEPIGHGSFGQVYRGQHRLTKEPVAIKILDLDRDTDELADVRKEIAIISNCACPYITRYHASYLIGSKLWVVMDYCGGGSMRDILKSGPLDERFIAVVVEHLLLALCYLHNTAHIIHRDIKAANILTTTEGEVKLCDFG
jgi:serine/threonine protein kinase